MTGAYQEAPYRQPRLQLEAQNKAPFDVQKEKDIFLDAWREFIDENQVSNSSAKLNQGPILEMPQEFNQLF